MKRHVLVHIPVAPEAEQRMAALFRSNGVAFWHWVAGTWLIADFDDSRNALLWRELIHKELPELLFILVEANPSWSAYLMPEAYAWLNTEWLGMPLASLNVMQASAAPALPQGDAGLTVPTVTTVTLDDADVQFLLRMLPAYINHLAGAPPSDQVRALIDALNRGKRLLFQPDLDLIKGAATALK